MIMAYLISNPQFNIWNISYITSNNDNDDTFNQFTFIVNIFYLIIIIL